MGLYDGYYSIVESVTLEECLAAFIGTGITIVPGSASRIGDSRAFGVLTQPPIDPLNAPLLSFVTSSPGVPNGVPDPKLGSSVLVMSTGRASSLKGSNTSTNTSTDFGLPGDAALAGVLNTTVDNTFDAAILEFQFTCAGTLLRIPYLFGSEEYNEFVDWTDPEAYFDGMAIWIDGVNVATLPDGTPIAVNKINKGNPYGTPPFSNPEYYFNNDFHANDAPIFAELDGFVGLNALGTVPMTVTMVVVPGQVYTLRIAICDFGDGVYDSAVFLGAMASTGIPLPFPCAVPNSLSAPAGSLPSVCPVASL